MTTAEYTTPRWGSARRDEAPQPRRDGGVVHELLRRGLRGPAPRGETPRPDPSRGRLPPARAAAGAGSADPRRPLRLRTPRRGPRRARLPAVLARPVAPLARHGRAPLPARVLGLRRAALSRGRDRASHRGRGAAAPP